jgi:hypothetical protein
VQKKKKKKEEILMLKSVFECFIIIIIIFWVNYSKLTCGLAGFNIAYLWFKTCHFTHLGFKTLAAVTHLAQFRQKNRSTIKATFFQSIFRVLSRHCCCDSILFNTISDFWAVLGFFLWLYALDLLQKPLGIILFSRSRYVYVYVYVFDLRLYIFRNLECDVRIDL